MRRSIFNLKVIMKFIIALILDMMASVVVSFIWYDLNAVPNDQNLREWADVQIIVLLYAVLLLFHYKQYNRISLKVVKLCYFIFNFIFINPYIWICIINWVIN